MEDVGLEPVSSRTLSDDEETVTVGSNVHDPEPRAFPRVERSGVDVRHQLAAALDRTICVPSPTIERGKVGHEHDGLCSTLCSAQQPNEVGARM